MVPSDDHCVSQWLYSNVGYRYVYVIPMLLLRPIALPVRTLKSCHRK